MVVSRFHQWLHSHFPSIHSSIFAKELLLVAVYVLSFVPSVICSVFALCQLLSSWIHSAIVQKSFFHAVCTCPGLGFLSLLSCCIALWRHCLIVTALLQPLWRYKLCCKYCKRKRNKINEWWPHSSWQNHKIGWLDLLRNVVLVGSNKRPWPEVLCCHCWGKHEYTCFIAGILPFVCLKWWKIACYAVHFIQYFLPYGHRKILCPKFTVPMGKNKWMKSTVVKNSVCCQGQMIATFGIFLNLRKCRVFIFCAIHGNPIDCHI